MIKHIQTDSVRAMIKTEGLVLQGCDGDPQEWLDGINEMLTEAGILQNGRKFTDISVFTQDGLTNILFPFDGMDSDTLNIGKLAMWRLQTHDTFGGTWLSDYLPNKLGVDLAVFDEKESVIEKIREAKAAAKATPQHTPEKEHGGHEKNYEPEV